MTALVLAVLSASLLGSLHCAGMCGAFVTLAVSDSGGGPRAHKPLALQGAYHTGRLLTYLLFGAVAGAAGATLDLSGSLVGVQRTATILAASMLVIFGALTLLRVLGVHTSRPYYPQWLARAAQHGHRAAWTLDPLPRALVIGLLTTLLPCGWLYAFVVTAAGTANPLSAMAVMGVFWLGTLPALTLVGVGARRLAGPLADRVPALTAVALISVGVFTLVHRANLIGLSLPPAMAASQPTVPDPHATVPCCDAK